MSESFYGRPKSYLAMGKLKDAGVTAKRIYEVFNDEFEDKLLNTSQLARKLNRWSEAAKQATIASHGATNLATGTTPRRPGSSGFEIDSLVYEEVKALIVAQTPLNWMELQKIAQKHVRNSSIVIQEKCKTLGFKRGWALRFCKRYGFPARLANDKDRGYVLAKKDWPWATANKIMTADEIITQNRCDLLLAEVSLVEHFSLRTQMMFHFSWWLLVDNINSWQRI